MAETADTTMLQVEGMTCTGCEQRIGAALRRVDGVRDVSADHISGEVRVQFNPRRTDRDAVRERIALAGYTVHPEGPSAGGTGR